MAVTRQSRYTASYDPLNCPHTSMVDLRNDHEHSTGSERAIVWIETCFNGFYDDFVVVKYCSRDNVVSRTQCIKCIKPKISGLNRIGIIVNGDVFHKELLLPLYTTCNKLFRP